MRFIVFVVVVAALGACGRIGFDDGASLDFDAIADRYTQEVSADGPLAYFRFDETAGPILRSYVGSITGTYEGDFAFGVPGAVGGTTVRFDGATTRVSIGDVLRFPGNAPHTVEVWVRPTRVDSTRFILDRGGGPGNDGYNMYYGDGYTLYARTSGADEFGYASVGEGPAVGAWSHIVAVYDGAVSYLYVDGAEVASNQGAGRPIGDSIGEIVLGDSVVPQFNKIDGSIDELAIYSTAFSGSHVRAHYAIARP